MEMAREQRAGEQSKEHISEQVKEQISEQANEPIREQVLRQEDLERPEIKQTIHHQTQERRAEPQAIDVTSHRLVAVNDFNLPVAEEYRKLKSSIVQIVDKEPSKNMFLVTSSIGGEGKSMTALNLAISLAQEHGKKVLLIDADLRKPSIAKYLGLSTKIGLSEYLKGNASLDEILIETSLGGLTCLPGGTSEGNPVELYSSQKMKELLLRVKERFRYGYIIIDSSPVLPFAEARILATLADGVIYIVKEGSTSMKNIEEGLSSVHGANVVGLVYNKASTASLAGGYHYYYYNYDYKRRYEDPPTREQSRVGSFLSRFKKSNLSP